MFSSQVYSCFCGLPYGGTVLLRLLYDVVQEPGSSNCNILLSESFRILFPNPLNSAGQLKNTSGSVVLFTTLPYLCYLCVTKVVVWLCILFTHFTVQYLHLCLF